MNLNGPVPTGLRCKLSLSASKLRGTMASVAMETNSGAVGSFNVNVTVVASVATTLSMVSRRLASGEAMSFEVTRWKLATTSAASTGAPLWNVMPGRSLKT